MSLRKKSVASLELTPRKRLCEDLGQSYENESPVKMFTLRSDDELDIPSANCSRPDSKVYALDVLRDIGSDDLLPELAPLTNVDS